LWNSTLERIAFNILIQARVQDTLKQRHAMAKSKKNENEIGCSFRLLSAYVGAFNLLHGKQPRADPQAAHLPEISGIFVITKRRANEA
jgi:hypothetical protein